jgi:hypothetical protein
MIFKEFLRELQKRLNGSSSYPMTNQSVNLLLTSKQLLESDKKIIFSSLINDNSKYKDPFLLAVFWNDNINDPNLKFKF